MGICYAYIRHLSDPLAARGIASTDTSSLWGQRPLTASVLEALLEMLLPSLAAEAKVSLVWSSCSQVVIPLHSTDYRQHQLLVVRAERICSAQGGAKAIACGQLLKLFTSCPKCGGKKAPKSPET